MNFDSEVYSDKILLLTNSYSEYLRLDSKLIPIFYEDNVATFVVDEIETRFKVKLNISFITKNKLRLLSMYSEIIIFTTIDRRNLPNSVYRIAKEKAQYKHYLAMNKEEIIKYLLD